MSKLLISVVASSLGLVAGAIEPETDAAGNYVFTVASGEETCSEILSGGDDVIKKGDGKLTLTGVNTLTGTYRVEQGTLQMAATAHPGTGVAKPSLVVAAGATFVSDDPTTGGAWSNIPFETMTLAGAGVDGQGAFVRDGAVLRGGGLTVTLAGDTTISVKSMWNPGAVNLNGYKLTKIGAGQLDGYNKTFTADGDGGKGSVCIAEGRYLNQEAYNLSGGSAENVLTLSGGATYDLYSRNGTSAPSEWTLNVAGPATVASHDATGSAVWNGPLQAADVLTLCGDAAAGLEVLTFKGPATVGDVTIGTPAVVAEFQGETSLTGTVFADNGTLRLKGCESVGITGAVGSDSKNHVSRYELVDVGLARHSANVYLNGKAGDTTPTTFCLTNSVWDGHATEFVVCANFCRSVLDICDSVFTNATWVGGRYAAPYAGIGAFHQRGGSFYGPLHLNAQPGNAAYIKESGFFDNAKADLQVGGNGFGAVHLLAGDNAVGGSLKMESSGDWSTNGGTVYYQAGGSNDVYMIYQSAQKEGCESVLALEGPTTVLKSSEWSVLTMKVDPSLAFTAVSAINDGARLTSGRFARDERCPKTEGAQAKWYLSFDGGIVHQTYHGDWFVDDSGNRAPDKVIVYEGGVSIDTTGCTAEAFFSVPFEAPVGKIVESIDLPTDAAFANEVYLTPVKVEIHGVGAGAAAIAILDRERRTIREIKVVARGTGYDDTTTATIEAAAHQSDSAKQVKYACNVNLAEAPTTGAGLRKLGTGTLDLRKASTFRGPVTVREGTVRFRVANSLPEGASLVVGDGATADFTGGYGAASEPVAVPTLDVAGNALVTGLPEQGLRVTEALKVNAEIGKKAYVAGTLVLADGVTISGIDVANLNAERKNVILEADRKGGILCEGTVNLPEVPKGWRAYISGRRLYVSRERGLAVVIR